MGAEFGGNSFNQPQGPIYPNTEWHVHVCDAWDILHKRAIYCRARVQQEFPTARSVKEERLGWRILDEGAMLSGCQTFYDTEDAAWIGAKGHCFPNEAEGDPAFAAIKDKIQPRSVKNA